MTYLAKDSQTGKRWELKTLNPDDLKILNVDESNQLRTQFRQESQILAKFDHPNIAKVGSPFEDELQPYLPIEYLQGRSVEQWSNKVMLESTALEYIRQVGDALNLIHKENMIHRDVRPSNIFLRINDKRETEAVLTNFGLVLDFDRVLTTTRVRQESEGFTPPELCVKRQPVRAYSDVYSLAATLYQLLTGEVPLGALLRQKHEKRFVFGSRKKGLISPKQHNSKISQRTNQAILDGMELDPKNRPQSVSVWLDMLGVGLLEETEIPAEKIQLYQEQKPFKGFDWLTFWGALSAIGTVGAMMISAVPYFKILNLNQPENIIPLSTSTPITGPAQEKQE